jgi:uncharacterized protein
MQRHAMKRLESWIAAPNRKPLLIRGARQVGKSTLVHLFAERSQRTLHEVDLERHPELDEIFASRNTSRILSELEYLIDKGPIDDHASLLFLDEIQAAPSAVAALRSLHEDRPDLPVIAAGSLLEFVLADHTFSMPVGRIEYLFLEIMGFEEFLAALDETSLLELLRTHELVDDLPGTAHTRLLGRLRDYMLVGGMPEAVRVFAETGSFAAAGSVHASIIETYRDDFAKYGTRSEIAQLRRIYGFVPGAVGEKFKYSRVDSDARSRDVKRALELLVMARVVRRVTHTEATGLPLGATLKESAFKTYFLDVGLVNAACGIDRLTPEQVADARFVNEGAMAEQFIAQHLPLLAPDDRVYTPTYWLREGRTNNAEVDFVHQLGADVAPIEVKAGKSGTLKSLLELVAARRYDRALRFDTNPPLRQHVSHARTHVGDVVEFTLLSLPLYMVEQTVRLWRGL